MDRICFFIVLYLSVGVSCFAQSPKDKIINLGSVNTEFSEYSPQWVDSTLIYCTTGLPKMNINTSLKTGYFRAMQDKLDSTKFTDPQLYLKDVLNVIHVGPFVFNKSRDTLFYTTTDLKAFQKADFLNKMKISIAVKSGNSWKNIDPFPYYSDEYNTGHPALSYDSKDIYFSSDREGGHGGMDIWHSRYENGAWGQPVNMGPEINTGGTEAFPSLFKDKLYFSSKSNAEGADFDIYYSEFDENWQGRVKLKAPVNSTADDFGITFQKTGLAFFSSNREGGLGEDDIYAWTSADVGNVFSLLSGRLMRKDEIVNNVEVSLMNSSKALIQTTVTDEDGRFELRDIDGANIYSMRMDLKEDSWKQGYVLELFNLKGQLVKRIAQNEFGEFHFELLATDDYDKLSLIEEADDSFLDIPLRGMLYYETEGDAGPGLIVYMLDDNNNVIDEAESDSLGNFNFGNVFPRDTYKFRVNDGKEGLKIIIYNGKGEIVQTLVKSRFGDFVYERLALDDSYVTMLNEDDVLMNIKLDDSFTANNIYYELDKWNIMPESEPELNRIAGILLKNPQIGINLEAHTDSRGSSKYNLMLSEKRAESTKNYFIKQGIAAERITAKGYGEGKLKNHCADGVSCNEEKHAENRRSEVNFVKL